MPVPLEIPVIQFPTPNSADRVLVETWDTLRANQEPLHPGAPHPNVRDYPNYVFVRQSAIDGTEKFVHRVWVNDRACEDAYNYSIDYVQDDPGYPIFTREYLVRRENYATLTLLSKLTGITWIKVTNGGSGYTDAPTVSFTGGTGTGLVAPTATAIVFRGVVAAVILTSEGSGYVTVPAVVFTPVNGGTSAAATAMMQPSTAVLVSQRLIRAKDEPVDSLFVRVLRVWETLPGPVISGTQIDETTGIVVHYTKQIVAAGTAGGISSAAGITYYSEVQPLDAAHSIKITSWIVASELPSETTYPATTELQLAADTYSVSALNAISGIQEAHGAHITRTAGARGPALCTISEKYVNAAGLASLVSAGFGTMRTITSGSTGTVYSGTLAVTSFQPDFSGHAQTFSVTKPLDDVIAGTTLAVHVGRMRFGVFRVTTIVKV